MKHLKIISAGAGSGKTYRLTQEMAALLSPQEGKAALVRPSGIIATTFTNKAAAELKERVRIKLLEDNLSKEADELGNAMIGTVHAIGVQLLKRFAFEAGVSPEVDIIADSDQQMLFNQSLASVLPMDLIYEMEQLSESLGFNKSFFSSKDWRADLKQLTDVARSNNFDAATLEASKNYSLESFFELLPAPAKVSGTDLNQQLRQQLEDTLKALQANEDGTKSKLTLMGKLKGMHTTLVNRGSLPWYYWAQLSKLKAPKKSREDVAELMEFAQGHESHPDLHQHIHRYISGIFDTAIEALAEYERYKKQRGLIDYIDMEVLILKLLEQDSVKEVLAQEIDLLLVDEFQDTNPIQLEIFLQLTQIANQSIWVGDPKQSIYGFRGAAPDLMKAVMEHSDNIDNLPNSWRSRQDLVHLSNGLFVEAFGEEMPVERIALETAPPFVKEKEAANLGTAALHWHFQFEGNKVPAKPWTEACIAKSIATILEEKRAVRLKGSNETRPIKPGDIAVLCRSNRACQTVAEALHKEGLKASISRNGLLQTAEIRLVLACLRYILNKHDALAVAEILLLAQKNNIESIIENRLDYLEQLQLDPTQKERWGNQDPYIQQLRRLRHQSRELSATEILSSILEKLDIRRTIVAWGQAQQRLDNIDALRKLAMEYEATCQRLHSAATLGGFLLWLDELMKNGLDEQGKGAGADAINVMTYHKSKGLEWPFVVCHSLSNDLRENLWGLRIVRTQPEIDLSQPLANRLICYWINPYADQNKGTALMERVIAHPASAAAKQEALAEEARLLYVGITRARDYLVFPSVPKRPTKWLNRVFHHGDDSKPSLDLNSSSLLWLWKGEEIPLKTQTFNYEVNMAYHPQQPEVFHYWAPYSGTRSHEQAHFEQAQQIFPHLAYQLKKTNAFASPLAFTTSMEEAEEAIQQVFKTFVLGDQPTQFEEALRLEMAQALLEKYQLEDILSTAQLLGLSQQLHEQLHARFGNYNATIYQQFKYSNPQNRYFNGQIDLVLTSEQQDLVLVQLPSFSFVGNAVPKQKLREEICLLEAAARSLGNGQQEVTLLLVQLVDGVWQEVLVQKDGVQASLF